MSDEYLTPRRARVRQSYSNLERVTLRWLLMLVGAGAAIWLVAIARPLLSISTSPARDLPACDS